MSIREIVLIPEAKMYWHYICQCIGKCPLFRVSFIGGSAVYRMIIITELWVVILHPKCGTV